MLLYRLFFIASKHLDGLHARFFLNPVNIGNGKGVTNPELIPLREFRII